MRIWDMPGGVVQHPSQPKVTARDLRRLAQYILSAAHQLEFNRLSPDAISLLGEWYKAAECLRGMTGEFPGSCADTATKRALGMLEKPQLAKDAAAEECEALLSGSDRMQEMLADADWAEAAACITRDVIAAYHVALVRGQE